MRVRIALFVLWLGVAKAQSGVPTFRLDRVLPSGATRPTQLVPGMLVSIYGTDLGPAAGCTGQADASQRETPSPLRPDQSRVETAVYPKELCGVQVLLGNTPSGLLYVQERQINFKVPQDALMSGTAPLRVVYQGRSSAAVEAQLGLEAATLSLEQPAYAGGPVWVHIQLPSFPSYGDVRYPVGISPADFRCQEVEVRRNGTLLPRIPVPAAGFGGGGGLMCGSIGIPGHEIQHKGRLPLHLQYRFDQPGVYEARYTRWRGMPGMPGTPDAEPISQTAWTRIEILPAQAMKPGAPPQDPAEAISDYLPSILGFPDAAHLTLVAEYLYHPNETVRQYTSLGLAYWPDSEVDRRLTDLLHTRGPSDVVVERTFRTPGAVDFILPGLASENPVLVRGAVIGVTRLLSNNPPLLSAEARSRTEDALIAAAEHVLRAGDRQTAANYASALGGVHDPRARDLLWNFVGRNVQTEQALIAISWFKNPADLPRFGDLLARTTYAMLPYAVLKGYGDAAVPVLEAAMQKSGDAGVQTSCARELVQAGRTSGFAFIAQAIEQNRPYRREMVQFVQERFPDLRGADDGKVLAFLKARL